MASPYIFTPCDKYYESCATYIVNDFSNQKCLNCLRNHQYKNIKNVVNHNKIKDYFKEGVPQRKLPYWGELK